jgi:hypothetical protein
MSLIKIVKYVFACFVIACDLWRVFTLSIPVSLRSLDVGLVIWFLDRLSILSLLFRLPNTVDVFKARKSTEWRLNGYLIQIRLTCYRPQTWTVKSSQLKPQIKCLNRVENYPYRFLFALMKLIIHGNSFKNVCVVLYRLDQSNRIPSPVSATNI